MAGANYKDYEEEVRQMAEDDYDSGVVWDPDDFSLFRRIFSEDHVEIDVEPNEFFEKLFEIYFEHIDALRASEEE